MQALKCSRCETLTYEGHFNYPVCYKCRENLFKCRYCRFYPQDGQRCRKAPDKPIIHGDDVRATECGKYHSTLLASPRGMRRPVDINAWACLLMTMVMGLAVAGLSVAPVREAPSPLATSIVCPDSVRLGETLEAHFDVGVLPRNRRHNVNLRLEQTLFEDFFLVGIEPKPTRIVPSGRNCYIFFEGLPSDESVRVTLRLRALQVGTHHLTAKILTNNHLSPKTMSWRVAVHKIAPPAQQTNLNLLSLLSIGALMPVPLVER